MPSPDPNAQLKTPEAFAALRKKIEDEKARIYKLDLKTKPIRTRLWALWNLFFGTPGDDQYFTSSWRWWARLFAHMAMAGVVVGALVAMNVLSFGAPMVFASAVMLGLAFNYALEYLRDHLIPTVQKIREKYVAAKWASDNPGDRPNVLMRVLFKIIPTRGNEQMVDGYLARQCIIPQPVQENGTPRETQKAFLQKFAYRVNRNALRSFLGGLVMVVAAMLAAAFLSGVIGVGGASVAGLTALALPAAVAAGFAVLALGFRLAATEILNRSLVSRSSADGAGAEKLEVVPAWSNNPHRWKHTFAHGLLAASGLCAMLALAALVAFALPHVSAAAFIHGALTFFHVGTSASLPAAAAILGGLVTALATGLGMLLGGLRSWLYKQSGDSALLAASWVTDGVKVLTKPEEQYKMAIPAGHLSVEDDIDDHVNKAFLVKASV